MADKAEGKEEQKSAVEQYEFEEEIAEEFHSQNYGAYVRTGFPRPFRRLRLVYESQQANIENAYFWMYNSARQDWGFGDVIKTIDTFAASENSSFFGMTEQRKNINQDKASQYLATIGNMTKQLFQIVREIRILRERLALYKGAAEGKQADDVALKGYWVDMVEGGTKGGANIYVMANQLGFGTLPDLFFGIYVKDADSVDKAVDEKAKEFNDKVKEVLRRKLATYMRWREETYREMMTRHKFTLRYLRQHWAIIRMYMSWVKPYLRNVQKLSAPDKYHNNPELISSFEGAVMEIEFLARKAPKKPGGPAATILATFTYRVKPQLQFQAEGYQRGAVHVGRIEISLRSYGWTDADVAQYLKLREQETLNLIKSLDTSVKDAMDALGDELLKYLEEAGEDMSDFKPKEPPKAEKKPERVNLFEPFVALFDGFKEMGSMPFEGLFEFKEEKKKTARGMDKGSQGLAKSAAGASFNMYKNFKKSNGMPAW